MTAHIDVVGLVTSDADRTVAFYRALGCIGPEEPADLGADGHLDIGLGQLRLMLDTEQVMRSFDPSWDRPSGRLSLAARCADARAVDELHATLSALGAGSHLKPFDAPWGQRYASVLDPDGVRIDLYADLG